MFEFQIDEQQDEVAANVKLRLSTGPVGACVPVPDASIVDADGGIAGGYSPHGGSSRSGDREAPGDLGGQR